MSALYRKVNFCRILLNKTISGNLSDINGVRITHRITTPSYCVLRHLGSAAPPDGGSGETSGGLDRADQNEETGGVSSHISSRIRLSKEMKNLKVDRPKMPSHMWKDYRQATRSWRFRREEPEPLEEYEFDQAEVARLLEKTERKYKSVKDMPVGNMPNPYMDPPRKCILCQYNVEVDHKNVQLLSQFVSPLTGRIYGRHITGLCIPMQRHVSKMIRRSRNLGFMPFNFKKTEYIKDPLIKLDVYSKVRKSR